MTNFFNKLWASLSSTEYYRSVLYQSFWEVFWFYAGVLLLISLILTAEYWIQTKPYYQSILTQTTAEIAANYPDNLQLEWTGEKILSSVDPLILPFPSAASDSVKDFADVSAVYTASEAATPSVNTLFLVTPTNLHTVSEGEVSSGVKLTDLISAAPLTVTKAELPSFLERVQAFIQEILALVGYVYPLVAFAFLMVTSLYILVIESAIIFLLLKLQKSPLNFRQLFQLNMALFVPAQIINLVTQLADLDVPISMLSLSFWILFVFVYFTLQRKKTA